MTNNKQTTFGYIDIELLSAAKNIYYVLGSSTSAMKVANCCLSTVGWLYRNCQANANGGSLHGVVIIISDYGHCTVNAVTASALD